MPTVLGHLLNQNIIVFGWEYLFCRPTRTIQQIVKTIWWYIYGSNYSFTGSCFMYIYTIYWLKQTLPLIKFVKISKISCFYFSMVLYFKTVYFPLISKITIENKHRGLMWPWVPFILIKALLLWINWLQMLHLICCFEVNVL